MATVIQSSQSNGGIDRKTKTLNTRIALKADSVEKWQQSTMVLYPGELAISYEIADDGSKYDFRIRIGNRTTWRNSPELKANADVDPGQVIPIIEDYLVLHDYCTRETVDNMISDAFGGEYFDNAFAGKFAGGGYDTELSAVTTDSIVMGTNTWILKCGDAKTPDDLMTI